jgi:hypothetical protein
MRSQPHPNPISIPSQSQSDTPHPIPNRGCEERCAPRVFSSNQRQRTGHGGIIHKRGHEVDCGVAAGSWVKRRVERLASTLTAKVRVWIRFNDGGSAHSSE